MYPILGTVAGVTIYSFTVTTIVAIVVASGVVGGEAGRRYLPARLWWRASLAAASGGLAGARLWSLARGYGPGLVWYGGVAGGALAATVVLRAHRVRWLDGADAIAPALALGLAIGRLGCHLAGDGDWGPPTALPWGVRYVDGVASWPYPTEVRVHPSMLYEAAASVGIFLVLRRRRAAFWQWCVLAGGVRLLVEVVRREPVVAAGLTEAQLVSVGLIALGTAGLARFRPDGPSRYGSPPCRRSPTTRACSSRPGPGSRWSRPASARSSVARGARAPSTPTDG